MIVSNLTKTSNLTKKELLFCQYYCEFGCSGVDAIYKAGYNPKTRRTAISMASENLTKPNILAYINEFFKKITITHEEVLHELWYLIKQQGNLPVKAKALDMYFRKNSMYESEKPENKTQTVVVTNYANLSDEQIESILEDRLRKKETVNGYKITLTK